MRLVGAAALAAALSCTPALAGVDSTAGTPPRVCQQLATAPRAPPRPSGRAVRVVTHAVVQTLRVAADVAHPAFFAFPHEQIAGGCEIAVRDGRGLEPARPRRGRGDAGRR